MSSGSTSIRVFIEVFREVFWKEFRHCLRDKDVFVYTFIVPAVIYPLLMLVFSEVLMFQEVADKTQKVKFALLETSPDPGLQRIVVALEKSGKYELVNPANPRQALARGDVAALISRGLRAGKSVARLEISRGFKSISLPASINEDIEQSYQKDLAADFALKGLEPANLQVFSINLINIDPQKRSTLSPVLALLAFSLCTMTLGAAYPAIACAAEEFERNTIETSALLPVPRSAVMLGKLASVTIFGASAGLLNALSTGIMASSIASQMKKLLPVALEDTALKLDFMQIVTMLALYLLLSVAVASCLILVSSLCRTVRSAQHWISFPLTVIMVMPALLIMPNLELNWQLAWVPALNLSLLIKSIFNGVRLDGSAVLAIIYSLVLVLIFLRLAQSCLFDGIDPAAVPARLFARGIRKGKGKS